MRAKVHKNIVGVLLAAGSGSRFGGGKLSAGFGGQTLLQHALQPMQAVFADRVLVVLGYEWQRLASDLQPGSPFYVINDGYAEGMGTSLALAIRAVRHAADAIVVMLADQPDITVDHVHRLMADWSGDDNEIVASHAAGVDCPPVLFPHSCFDELSTLRGDSGGRHLLADRRFRVTRLEFAAAARDIDTQSELANRC